MNYILFEQNRENLLPLTATKPVSEIRIGIIRITEKWEHLLSTKCSFVTPDYLSKKYPVKLIEDNVFINGGIIPDEAIIEQINDLQLNEVLKKDDKILAYRSNKPKENFESFHVVDYKKDVLIIENPWDIFKNNGICIENDFRMLTKGRKSAALSETNKVLAPENVFVEEGAKVECAIINAKSGPVYIGKDAEIMEGAVIRGPFALCEHAAVKLSAKIYGPTTVGPHSKVGGEINNSVIIGYSNKGHDGFLGNSVLGEWCNIGADSNNSNLKNNYAEVKLWNYEKYRFVRTGLQFCGLIMGDHSKCGINTMFNTGTVVGVSANIFGSGFPRNFVPDFSWGGAAGFKEYNIDKALETAGKVMIRRGIELDEMEKDILTHIFEETQSFRR